MRGQGLGVGSGVGSVVRVRVRLRRGTFISSFHHARIGLSSSKLTRSLTALVIVAPILVLRLSTAGEELLLRCMCSLPSEAAARAPRESGSAGMCSLESESEAVRSARRREAAPPMAPPPPIISSAVNTQNGGWRVREYSTRELSLLFLLLVLFTRLALALALVYSSRELSLPLLVLMLCTFLAIALVYSPIKLPLPLLLLVLATLLALALGLLFALRSLLTRCHFLLFWSRWSCSSLVLIWLGGSFSQTLSSIQVGTRAAYWLLSAGQAVRNL